MEATTGVAVEGALIRVLSPEASALTDTDGRFSLAGQWPARVTLQVMMLGYALIERDVDTAGHAVDVVFALTEAPPSYAEQVEVKGEAFPLRQPTVPSEMVIGSNDLLLLRGILADDPFRAVQAMPGVTSGDDFTAEFSVRGSGPDHVGILVDGVPAPVVLHTVQGRNDTGSVSMINSDLLESVAVSGGSYPPRTGNRTGAQVDFTTRPGVARAHADARPGRCRDRVGRRARAHWARRAAGRGWSRDAPATPGGSCAASIRRRRRRSASST